MSAICPPASSASTSSTSSSPQYVVPKERKDVVKRLKDDARGKTSVLLATDPDREGEAIAWHLLSALGLDGDQPVSRIEFHEVTDGAVLAAMQHPRGIDMDRVDAQQARRVVDRLIGYPVSTFLGSKIRRGLSAGRVQSVAVRIVVDREREIQAFVPVEYWSLKAELSRRQNRKATFTASLLERERREDRPQDRASKRPSSRRTWTAQPGRSPASANASAARTPTRRSPPARCSRRPAASSASPPGARWSSPSSCTKASPSAAAKRSA